MNLSLSNMLSSTASGLDPDAKAYIAAVETEDGQALESGVRKAINNFVVGCKGDGIWDAIKASCILAGARTLDGALVPLVGTAPTNNNFVSGDYNRETGLVGDGSTKYLNSNRNNNADPQNNRHLAINITNNGSGVSSLMIGCGASSDVGRSAIARVYAQGDFFRLSNSSGSLVNTINSGFIAASRSLSASFVARSGGSNTTFFQTSETPKNEDTGVFARTDNSGHSNARLSFYSIGESLDLAALDTRVSTLMEQIFKGIYGIDFDDDAYAYITEIRSYGASVDSTQINAINTFVKTGKSDGWYSSIKRLYLPIWASAAPNAIDMIGLTSGTFNGTVTHSAGYVQGDGTTGYFDMGVSPSSLGMNNDSAFLSALLLSPAPATGTNRSIIGARKETAQDCRIFMPSAGGMSGIIMDSSAALISTTDRLGILIAGRKSGTRYNGQRKTSGWSVLNTATDSSAGTAPLINFYGLAFNFDGTASGFVESRVGAMVVGLGLDASQSEVFTLALKNLWETCTGLTLP